MHSVGPSHIDRRTGAPALPLLPLLLVSFAITSRLVGASLTVGDTGDDDDGQINEPISEAQQIYCAQCASSCARLNAAHKQTADRNKAPDNADKHAHTFQLNCQCEAVFDARKRALTCKNMSAARAQQQHRNVRLEALAKSVAHNSDDAS